LLQINEKAPDPGSEMFFKELTICAGRTGNISADKSGHDFAKNGGVILGLRISRCTLNAELPKRFA
jgi:hypothetical protein